MDHTHHSWQFRLLVAERKFLVGLGAQALLATLLLHMSVNAQDLFVAARRAGGPVDPPFHIGVFEALCWLSIFLALRCALLFLRWIETSRATAGDPVTEDGAARPRTLFGWVVPLASLLRPQPATAGQGQPDAALAPPLSFSRLTWWWAGWVLLHLAWLAIFLFAVGQMQAAVAGVAGALAKAIVACRLSILVQLAALAAAGLGFVLTNVQMRRLFALGGAEPLAASTTAAGSGATPVPETPPRPAHETHRPPRTPPARPADHAAAVATAAPPHEDLSDIGFYATVAREMAGGAIDDGLWTKAYALENGDERATRAHYIKLRVEQLEQAALSPAAIEHAPPAPGAEPHLVDIEA